MFRQIAVAVLMLASFSVAAESSEFGIYFPASCPGSLKAARAYHPETTIENGALKVSFNLGLLECAVTDTSFQVYQPRPNEYVQMYEIYNAHAVSARSPIPAYDFGQDHATVELSVPVSSLIPVAKDGAATYQFRVDIFLYNQYIPFKLTVYQNGEAALSH